MIFLPIRPISTIKAAVGVGLAFKGAVKLRGSDWGLMAGLACATAPWRHAPLGMQMCFLQVVRSVLILSRHRRALRKSALPIFGELRLSATQITSEIGVQWQDHSGAVAVTVSYGFEEFANHALRDRGLFRLGIESPWEKPCIPAPALCRPIPAYGGPRPVTHLKNPFHPAPLLI